MRTIQSFYNALGKPNGDKPGLSPKSVKNVHGILHSALQQAVAIGYLRFNASDACTLPRKERMELTPLDEIQIAAFLKAIKGHTFEDLFTVALFTGMREGEVLGLLWDRIDFKRSIITVDRQLQRGIGENKGYQLVSTKNGKGRTISPAKAVMDILKHHRGTQAQQQLKAGEAWEDHGFVFTNDLGQPLTKLKVYRAYKRVVTSIGRPDARSHDLRHSYAVAAIHSGNNIKTVQGNLGHGYSRLYLRRIWACHRSDEAEQCSPYGRIHNDSFNPVREN